VPESGVTAMGDFEHEVEAGPEDYASDDEFI
jgi:hypothetical protein